MTMIKKNTQTISSGEGVERREPSYIVGRKVNWYSQYGEQYGGSLKKNKNRATILFYDPTPGPISGENHGPKGSRNCTVHSSTFHNNRNKEAT